MPKEVKTTDESLVEVGKTVLANTQAVDKDCVIKFANLVKLKYTSHYFPSVFQEQFVLI